MAHVFHKKILPALSLFLVLALPLPLTAAADDGSSALSGASTTPSQILGMAIDGQAVPVDGTIDTTYPQIDINAKSAILVDASTGTVLYEKDADTELPPASVTKVMTMLLVMEAVDDGRISMDDMVTVSDFAASMGGSQVFLEPGEQMSVRDMLKAVAIASGNDACVALAEFVAGSADAFVAKMNERAAELGMTNTHFVNSNGLDADGHYSTARDIALMSRELITKHPQILQFTSTWMDSLRDGAFTLANTNKLIRFYRGANGLKTGSTGNALYCISAAALRDGMQLIAVTMGSPSSDDRFTAAKKLLDYGFATYAVAHFAADQLDPIAVAGGKQPTVPVHYGDVSILVRKGDVSKIEKQFTYADKPQAPIVAGQKLGTVDFSLGGQVVRSIDIIASESVDRLGWWDSVKRILGYLF